MLSSLSTSLYGRALGFFQRPRSSSWWSFLPGLSVCYTWFLRNLNPFQTSAFKVDYAGFHQILSNVLRLFFLFSSDTSSHPTYKPTGFIAKGVDDNWEEVSSAHDVVNWTPTTVYLVWSPTKHNILHLILQFVPQGNVQELPIRNQDSPYQGFWQSEVHVRCLRSRLDSQSLVCVHSVGFRCSWLFLTVFLIISRGPTLFIFLYMSFA